MNEMMTSGVDVNMTLRKIDGQLTIAVLPRVNGLKDDAQNNIIPMTLTGTPQELDEGFLINLATPLQKVCGLLCNMKNFEQQSEVAQNNSKAAQNKKESEAKEQKNRKAKFDQLLKQGEDAEKQKNYKQALELFRKAREVASDSVLKSVDAKIESMKSWTLQGSLFDMETLKNTKEEKNVPESSIPEKTEAEVVKLPGEDFGENVLSLPKADIAQNKEDYSEYPDFPDFSDSSFFSASYQTNF